ncbi:cyclin-Q [Planococcus citri]|uniref:cyclin-Q n=1 Tax=Planococcus citri TaxID=170843 RepID=UPI0031F93E5E
MKGVIDVLELQGQREKHRKLINYTKHEGSYIGVRFIMECGMKLNFGPTTITTAAHIFHAFFKETDIKLYDMYLIGATCLVMASKIKNSEVKLRDVINVAHSTLFRGSSPLELTDKYWAMRDAIFQAELLIMRMIKFQFSIPDPFKYLLQYYKTMKAWLSPRDWKDAPLIQNALAFLTDFYHDRTVINYKPEHLAIASLFLTLQCHGVSVPNTGEDDGVAWFSVFDPELTRDKVWEIAERMMDCYDEEPKENS